MQANIADLTVL